MEQYLIWLLIALVGIGARTYGVLVGAGGGFILSPVLLLLAVSDPKDVPGTVLAAIAINAAFVAWTYRKVGVVDYRSGLLFAAAALPGVVIGAIGVNFVSSDVLRIAFGILLVLLAIQLALRPWILRLFRSETPRRRFTSLVRSRSIRTSDGQEYNYEFNEGFATSFNVVLGFISSFFGIGGGFLRTPILVLAFGFPVRVAAATSVFALAIYGAAGAVTHAALGHIEIFPLLLLSGTGLVIGGQIGARISGRVRGVWVLGMLIVVVLVLGVWLIWEGVWG